MTDSVEAFHMSHPSVVLEHYMQRIRDKAMSEAVTLEILSYT